MQKAERELRNLMFAITAGMATFVYYELGRRQRLTEGREENRRVWVDGKIGSLEDSVGSALTMAKIGKWLIGLAPVIAATVAVITLFVTHAI